jgi:hypothetical protein
MIEGDDPAIFHDGYVTPAYRQAGSNNENPPQSPFFKGG